MIDVFPVPMNKEIVTGYDKIKFLRLVKKGLKEIKR